VTVARSELFGKMKARVQKAAEDIVSSERGSAAVAEAMRRVQLGRRVIDEKATEAVSALGIATKADVERVARKIGKLRKQVQALIEAAEKR
jgi:polyhydroxyalkanoate synthesis regulator phasin